MRRDRLIFGILIVLVFVAMLACFYATAFYDERIYASDLPHHIRVAQLLFNSEFYTLNFLPHVEGYLLFHIAIKVTSVFIGHNYELAASILLSLANIATVIICTLVAEKIIKRKLLLLEKTGMIGIIFIIGLPLLGKLYLPQGTPNVWHNPTLIFSRPFALISLYMFYDIVERSLSKSKYTIQAVLFGLFSIIVCYTKPSFTIVFLPVAGCITIYQLVKHKFKNIKVGVVLLIAVMPTLLLLVYQYSLSFENNLTIIIQFGTFLKLNLFESILATTAIVLLPLSYLILFINKISNKKFLLYSWLTYAFGWAQYFFLTTKEVAYGDFCWGYFLSVFVLYFSTLIDLYEKESGWRKSVIVLLFCVQLVLGVYFFYTQWMMKGYLV